MERKSKRRILWEQVAEDKELIGTFVIGFFILLGGFLSELSRAGEQISTPGIVVTAIGLTLLVVTLIFYVRRKYRTTQWIVSTKHIPAVFAVGQPREAAEQMLKTAQQTITGQTGFKEFKTLEDFFNVSFSDLAVHKRERLKPDPYEWKDFIDDAQWQIRRFCDRLHGEKVYHVFLYGPSSLALGLGAVFGNKHRLITYQYSDGEYRPVINLTQDIRRIKQTRKETGYTYIQVLLPQSFTPDTAIILDLASHSARGDVRSYLEATNQEMAILEVVNTYGGNLTEQDWVGVVQEVHSIFNQVQASKETARIHLFHDMPVALAFGFGMALGSFVPVTVYNWETKEGTYYPVLMLNQLESII